MSDTIGQFTVTGETLSGIESLRALSIQERGDLARHCHGHRYGAGQQILQHAETTDDVYFIISGRVRATTCSREGKEVTYRDLVAGQMFGDLSAIDGKPRSAHVIALTDALVASLSARRYWDLIRTYPKVAEQVLKDLAALVRILSERVFEFSALSVPKRVHSEVLRLARNGQVSENVATINDPPTHAVLASRIGTHREAVTRELNRLEANGLIERRTRTLVVCDLAALERLAEGSE